MRNVETDKRDTEEPPSKDEPPLGVDRCASALVFGGLHRVWAGVNWGAIVYALHDNRNLRCYGNTDVIDEEMRR